MPVEVSDLSLVGAANAPLDDSSTTGGASDEDLWPDLGDMFEPGLVETYSDNGGDTTQTVTVHGLDLDGAADSEALSLNGQSVVRSTKSFSRVTRVILSAPGTGVVTVTRAPSLEVLATFPSGLSGSDFEVRRPFIATSAAASISRIYEKAFLLNGHATDTLLNAQVLLGAGLVERTGRVRAAAASTVQLDAAASQVDDYYVGLYVTVRSGAGAGQWREITDYDGATQTATVATPWATALDQTSVFEVHALLVALEDAVDDNNSVANRLTEPTGLESSGWQPPETRIAVPGSSLAAGEAIGVWLQLIRPPGAPALADLSYRLELVGTP